MRGTWNLKYSNWASHEQKGLSAENVKPYGHLWRFPVSVPAPEKPCNNVASVMNSKLSADLIMPKWWLRLNLTTVIWNYSCKEWSIGNIKKPFRYVKASIVLCESVGQHPMRPRLKSTLSPRSLSLSDFEPPRSLLAQHTLQSDYFSFPKRWHIVARKIFAPFITIIVLFTG